MLQLNRRWWHLWEYYPEVWVCYQNSCYFIVLFKRLEIIQLQYYLKWKHLDAPDTVCINLITVFSIVNLSECASHVFIFFNLRIITKHIISIRIFIAVMSYSWYCLSMILHALCLIVPAINTMIWTFKDKRIWFEKY